MGVRAPGTAERFLKAFLSSKLVWTVLVCGLLWVAARRAQHGLARDRRFLATPEGLTVAGPGWGDDAVIRPVRERLRLLGPVNLFDPDFEEKIRGALADVPHVACVEDVRRRWPDRYGISLQLFRPVAVVAWQKRLIPVTGNGVALPYEPYARACDGLFRITGLKEPPPKLGETWRSESLADGLEALVQIAPHLERVRALKLDRIDVSRAREPRGFVAMKGGAEVDVLWGRPRAPVGENPVEKKVSLLAIAAQNADAVRGQTVDVRFHALYLRQSPVE